MIADEQNMPSRMSAALKPKPPKPFASGEENRKALTLQFSLRTRAGYSDAVPSCRIVWSEVSREIGQSGTFTEHSINHNNTSNKTSVQLHRNHLLQDPSKAPACALR
jgi:hypothetical protein